MKNDGVKLRDNLSYNTRSSQHNFFVPLVQGMLANTFYYNSIKDGNDFPSELKYIANQDAFKKGLKDYLFEKLKLKQQCDF